MRVVLDTNVLVAALMAPTGAPHQLFEAFLSDRFTLITCDAQIAEFSRVTRYPGIRSRIHPAQAGEADYLVTGDKAGVLAVRRHGKTEVVTVREFLNALFRRPG